MYRITDKLLIVAVENYPDAQQRMGQFTLTRLANEIVYQRYQTALKQLADRGLHSQETSRAIQLLYGAAQPSSIAPPPTVRLSASGVQHRLNGVQLTAIERALAANDVFVIHGPPGTGNEYAHIQHHSLLQHDTVSVSHFRNATGCAVR